MRYPGSLEAACVKTNLGRFLLLVPHVSRSLKHIPDTNVCCTFNLLKQTKYTSLCLLLFLQDLMALKAEYSARPSKEETINDPTNPKHYWRFRLHVTIEKLLGDKELTGGIKELTVASHRAAEEGGAQERGPAPAKVHPYVGNGTARENGVLHQV